VSRRECYGCGSDDVYSPGSARCQHFAQITAISNAISVERERCIKAIRDWLADAHNLEACIKYIQNGHEE
jgi:hypothetical protein